MQLFKQTKDKNKMEGKSMRNISKEKLKNEEKLKNSEIHVGADSSRPKDKKTFKDKLKKFIKNNKVVAMAIEYILTIECFTMLFLLTTPSDVKAATFTDESGITWTYTLSNNQATNVYISSGLTSEMTSITIPSTLNGYPVVSTHCYKENNSYSSTYNIFGKKTNTTIEEVVFPASIKEIGFSTFSNCTGITSIEIPSSVTSIGQYAFNGCTGITSITIPESVTSIGSSAFQSCTGLTEIEIPSSVTSIGGGVFNSCKGLTSVTIGSGVTSIGNNEFLGCSGLTSIVVNENNKNYSSKDGILYNKEKTTIILCLEGLTGEINIPSSVTSIGQSAFFGCRGLTEIEIPNSVTSIENRAFENCTGLTTIEIPNSVTSIRNYAFASCSGLTSIEIPNSVTSIGEGAFHSCSGLTEIEIPNSVTSIGDYAFYYCTGLTGIEMPSSVTSIGSNAFYGCRGLTEIEIPDSVTSLGSNAFYNCTGLLEITIIGNKSQINNSVIRSLRNNINNFLDVFQIQNTNFVFEDGILYNVDKTKLVMCIKNNAEIVKIKEDVNSIENEAFYECNKITSIENSPSVTNIGQYAFYGCYGLTEIEIPDSVTSIGNYTFDNCRGLTSIEIPNSVTNIGQSAFYNCTGLTNLVIGNSVTSIGERAFERCSGLTSIEIPNSVTNIGKSAFYNCTGLTKITMPGTANIGSNTFYNVTKVEEVSLTGEGVMPDYTSSTYTYTPWYQSRNKIQSITIENGITSIGNYTFYNSVNTTNIYINNAKSNITFGTNWNSNAQVHYNAYQVIKNIESNFNNLSISDNIENNIIATGEDYIFYILDENENKVTNKKVRVKINDQMQELNPDESGKYSVENVQNDIEIIIGRFNGDIITGIDSNGISWNYKYQDNTAANIYYISGELGEAVVIPDKLDELPVSSLGDGNNNLFSNGSYTSITKITMPGTASIGGNAFYNVTNVEEVVLTGEGEMPDYSSTYSYTPWYQSRDKIQKITIEDGITSIGNYAFANCTGLTEITIPSGVTSIGNYAFNGCTGITSITIPESVTSIGSSAFRGCIGLTEIEIPSSVTSIAGEVFYGCIGLTEIEIPSSVTSIGSSAFRGCIGLTEIEIPNSVTIIGGNAFYQCTGLTSIEIPSSVTSIAGEVFYGCIGLTEIEIPSSVTSIGSSAFYNCTGLTSIEIPNSVTSIGSSAFYNCTGLRKITMPGKIAITQYMFSNVTNVEEVMLIGEGAIPNYTSSSYRYTPWYESREKIQSITIGEGITRIGKYAFSGCTALKKITMPGTATIEQNAFSGVTNVEEVILTGEGAIPDYRGSAYQYTPWYLSRDKIQSITIGDKITKIGNYAFVYCTGLTSIEIPDSVTSIGSSAFSGCTGITKLTMPGTATLGSSAFYNVTNVEEVIITGEGEMRNYTTSTYTYTPWYQSRNKIQTITIGDGITRIGNYTFYYCSGLTSIEIPESLITIGQYAFDYCSKLTEIYVDNEEKDVNFENYWDGQNSIIYVHYKNHMHNINIEVEEGLHIEEIDESIENNNIVCQGEYKFRIVDENNNVIKNKPVIMEKNLKIEKTMPWGQVQTKDLPSEVKRLVPDENGVYTIEATDTTRNILLKVGLVNGVVDEWTDSNGITWSYTFENKQARGLKYISGDLSNIDILEVPEKINGFVVISLADEAFKGANLKGIDLPDSIINIGQSAFENCTELETAVLPEGLQLISNSAFKGCTSLEQVELPEDLVAIGSECFSGCTSLSMNLELKNKLRGIGEKAFYGCTSLTGELILPEGLVQIDKECFSGCTGITKVTILPYTQEVRQISLSSNSNSNSNASTNISVVESTDISIFDDLKGIHDIEINGVVVLEKEVKIGQGAFNGCTGLKVIDIQAALYNFDGNIISGVFSECTSLNKVYLPKGTTKITCTSGQGINSELDIYVDMDREEVTEDIGSSILNNVNVHYKGDTHTIDVTGKSIKEGYSIQTVEGNIDNGEIACESTYRFKVLNNERIPVTDVQVRTKKPAQNISDARTLTANEDGIYTVNVKSDLEIIVGTGNGDTFTEEVDGITWSYTYEDGKAINVYYTSGTLGDSVIIPSYLNDLPVVSIYNSSNNGYNIFGQYMYNTTSVTEVILPETLEEIGNYALAGCRNITNITIPNGVTSIGQRAFYSCSNLTGGINIPYSITNIGQYAFESCSKLTDIYVNNNEANVKTEGTITYNSNVHYLDHKHSITINNDPREKVTFEEAEGHVEDGQILCNSKYSFRLLDEQGNVVKNKTLKLQTMKLQYRGYWVTVVDKTEDFIPNEEGIYTIESVIRNYIISTGATNGETKTYEDENGIVWQYTYENEKARALKYVSGDLSEIETLEVPDKVDGLIVTTLADEALKGQTGLKNVILPDSITNIGESAFEGCTGLETIVLPNELELISNKAFKGCSNLQAVELPDSLVGIGNESFSGCSSLIMDLSLQNGLQTIGNEAFKDCSSLEGELVLPQSIILIGDKAFSGCSGITKVIIMPYTGNINIDISNIGYNSANISINEISSSSNFLENTTAIEYNVLVKKDEYGQNVNVVDEYGRPVKGYTRTVKIGQNAFSGCTALEEMDVQAKVDAVDGNIISECPNLKDVYIASKSTEMDALNVPEGVTVHYLDSIQEVEIEAVEGAIIEVISGADEEGNAYCQSDYKFKVNIAKGSSYKGVVVKVGNKGEEKEVIKPDEDGIYTITRVLKDQEIEIIEGRTVEIKYVDNSGKEIAKSKIIAGLEGESYTTQSKEIQYYKWNGAIPENAEGVYTEEDIIVIYVYDNLPSGIITVKYIDKDGKEISEKETVQGYQGETYEILRKNIKGYKAYGVTPENAKGMFTEEDVEVIFVYEAIEEDIVVKYVDEEGNYIARDKTVYGDEEIEAKEIDGYKNTGKEEDGKEITYTYEDVRNRSSKWTTEQTLLVIAGMIVALTVIFIIIARREKRN